MNNNSARIKEGRHLRADQARGAGDKAYVAHAASRVGGDTVEINQNVARSALPW